MEFDRNHYRRLADYNEGANERVYERCTRLSDEERKRDHGAFFDSIHGTLNHILIGDRIWMARFSGQSVPSTGLDEILYVEFDQLWKERRQMDQRISAFVGDLDQTFLEQTISYVNNEGHRYDDSVRLLLPHMFNHQTHHRGQVHDMICRMDVEPPVLDMHRVLKPEPDEYRS